MKKHEEPVTACAWLPDGKWFISGSQDKNTYLWVKIYIYTSLYIYFYVSFFILIIPSNVRIWMVQLFISGLVHE